MIQPCSAWEDSGLELGLERKTALLVSVEGGRGFSQTSFHRITAARLKERSCVNKTTEA